MINRLAFAVIACCVCAACASLGAPTTPPHPQFVHVLRVLPRFHAAQAWGDKENAAVGKHFERLARATAQGQVILAGRTTEPLAQTFGIVIFEADNEQLAREFMETDLAVVAGVMSAPPHPYAVALRRKP